MRRVLVPDIGDFKDIPLIEILVKVGDAIVKDQPIAVLESDKAVMEVPSSAAGIVSSIDVKLGDRISAGAPLITLSESNASIQQEASNEGAALPATLALHSEPERFANRTSSNVVAIVAPPIPEVPAVASSPHERAYAGPAVRRLARELGVALRDVRGTGARGRIIPQDVQSYVKSVLSAGGEASSQKAETLPFALLPWPKVDFAKFGPIDPQPLSRIRKISAANLHRNWVSIPHVTNHDDADITDLEAFRAELNREHEGTKISPLAFIMKAAVAALKAFPEFNSSLDGETLILKRYYHIGFAADTPNGLVVPVIADADRKGIVQIAREMSELAAKARSGKLSSADTQGGTFSISSLGGIGGSYFTPIINAPEVAILGVGKMQTVVRWIDGQARPRLYLPLSLSWDHRVVDGAAAGRFNAYLVKALQDLRRLLT